MYFTKKKHIFDYDLFYYFFSGFDLQKSGVNSAKEERFRKEERRSAQSRKLYRIGTEPR